MPAILGPSHSQTTIHTFSLLASVSLPQKTPIYSCMFIITNLVTLQDCSKLRVMVFDMENGQVGAGKEAMKKRKVECEYTAVKNIHLSVLYTKVNRY
jgi:hypothetical protein